MPPSKYATAVRPPWFLEPECKPPPPPLLTDKVKRFLLALCEEEEANDARQLVTVQEEEEMEAAREWQEMPEEAGQVVRYSLQPLQGQTDQGDRRPMAASAPALYNQTWRQYRRRTNNCCSFRLGCAHHGSAAH
eukprot:6182294-Pleurochrysis_carterae.AAC.3